MGNRILASTMFQNVMRSSFFSLVMRNAQVDMLYFIHNLYYAARTDVLRITCQNYELLNHFKLTRALNTMQIVF